MRIDAISIGDNPPKDLNVIVEVPLGGHPIKYELDKESGTLVVDHHNVTRFAAFTYSAYTKYWTARLCSTFAAQIVAVAVAWQIYDLTRDPLDLGIIGLVQFLPLLLLVLITGATWQLASIIGPVAGGLLYGLSPNIAYGTAAGLFSMAFILTLQIEKPKELAPTSSVSFSSLFDGLRYIRKEKIVLGAISLDLFAVLLGGAVALLPVYARDVLELGPWGLGILRSAPGVGALIVAAWLAASPIKNHAGRIMFICVAIFGFFTIVFGLSTITWLSIIALAFVGAADMVSVYIRETLLQLWTPDHVRGRVNAVNMVFLGASNELGEFRAGFMAAWIGVIPAVVFGGVGAMLVAGLWAWKFPQLREAKHLEHRD
ncbi:Inorganic pyrophosphatase [Nymphon striatum]|nr:Inorganic pyrophosphatase [Nymphon striatum]